MRSYSRLSYGKRGCSMAPNAIVFMVQGQTLHFSRFQATRPLLVIIVTTCWRLWTTVWTCTVEILYFSKWNWPCIQNSVYDNFYYLFRCADLDPRYLSLGGWTRSRLKRRETTVGWSLKQTADGTCFRPNPWGDEAAVRCARQSRTYDAIHNCNAISFHSLAHTEDFTDGSHLRNTEILLQQKISCIDIVTAAVCLHLIHERLVVRLFLPEVSPNLMKFLPFFKNFCRICRKESTFYLLVRLYKVFLLFKLQNFPSTFEWFYQLRFGFRFFISLSSFNSTFCDSVI